MANITRSRWAYLAGCVAVTAGVVAHLPMVMMARDMGYRLAGMPVDGAMIAGMALILGGIILAAYGLLSPPALTSADAIEVVAPEDLPLGAAHWKLMTALVVALASDVMKPASLGFTVPGMAAEYGLTRSAASLLPFAALTGTVLGSILWGALADHYGRRASILLSAVMFVGTSICGAMPSFYWNLGMCLLMGLAAGGMLPVTYALLAEMMPSHHRGWSLVLVGGLGAVGGYFAASAISAWLQPMFGWRILWLSNLPTGLLLIALGRAIPESAGFLIAHDRKAEAEAVLKRFHVSVRKASSSVPRPKAAAQTSTTARLVALSVCGLAWGLANFGLLLWLPAEFVERGYSVGLASGLLAKSSLIAFPTVFLAAALYARWSSKGALAAMIVFTLAGLVLLARFAAWGGSPVLPISLLLVGTNGIIAIILPYAAENFGLSVRGRATGWVAACTKAGGLAAQALGLIGMIPTIGHAAIAILVPTALSLILVLRYGQETRGLDLRAVD